jgi:hypothetical protein
VQEAFLSFKLVGGWALREFLKCKHSGDIEIVLDIEIRGKDMAVSILF